MSIVTVDLSRCEPRLCRPGISETVAHHPRMLALDRLQVGHHLTTRHQHGNIFYQLRSQEVHNNDPNQWIENCNCTEPYRYKNIWII